MGGDWRLLDIYFVGAAQNKKYPLEENDEASLNTELRTFCGPGECGGV